MGFMAVNMIDTPEAFGEANRRVTLDYLQSLTLEKAAKQLERLYDLEPEFRRLARDSGHPPRRKSLPGTWLSVLLKDKPPAQRE
jgi:hypothetical protein